MKGRPQSEKSGGGHLLQLCGETTHLARTRVLVNHALGDGAHQLGLGLDEGGLRRTGVAARDGLLEFAQEGADARAARLVHFGAGSDLADRFLGAGIVGHQSNLTNGNAAEHGPRRGNLEERAAIAERGMTVNASQTRSESSRR